MEISAKYLKRMAAINCFLEVEIGITGGEEDGVDSTDANPEDLYSKPGRSTRCTRSTPSPPACSPSPRRSATCTASTPPATSSSRPHPREGPVHQGEGGSRHRQARVLRVQRLRLVPRGHPRGDQLRCHQDEHRHRHPVVVLGRRQGLRPRRGITSRARSATPTAPRSPTRSTTTPACGSARLRTTPSSASSRRTRTSTPSTRSSKLDV